MSAESAGRHDTQAVVVPSQRHLDLYQLLVATSHPDRAGRCVSWWPQAKLATKLGISVRTLQNLLADLREPGGDPRHRRGRPAGRRLGLLLVTPTMREDPATGGRLYAGNLYVLTPGRHATLAEPVSAAQDNRQDDPVACLNKGENLQPEALEAVPSPTGHWPTPRAREIEPIEIAVEPSASALLDRDPTLSEVLAAVGAVFGDLQVLEGPATYLTARRRLIDLATCSATDLHQAVDQLERHTCSHHYGPCAPGHPCRRHSRRRKT